MARYTNPGFQDDEEGGAKMKLEERVSDNSSGFESTAEQERDSEDTFDPSDTVTLSPKCKVPGTRRMSNMSERASNQNKRNHSLVEVRSMIQRICHDNTLNMGQLQTLLSDRRFCQILFNLFDERD